MSYSISEENVSSSDTSYQILPTIDSHVSFNGRRITKHKVNIHQVSLWAIKHPLESKQRTTYVNYIGNNNKTPRLYTPNYLHTLFPCDRACVWCVCTRVLVGLMHWVSCIVVKTHANTAGLLIDSQQNWPSTKWRQTWPHNSRGRGNGFWAHFDILSVRLLFFNLV